MQTSRIITCVRVKEKHHNDEVADGGHDKFAETLEQGLLMQAGRHAEQTIFIDQ